jgi:hypothetical protein
MIFMGHFMVEFSQDRDFSAIRKIPKFLFEPAECGFYLKKPEVIA